jgi:hypothetical protein
MMPYVNDGKTIDDSMTPTSATGSFRNQALKKTILVLQYNNPIKSLFLHEYRI